MQQDGNKPQLSHPLTHPGEAEWMDFLYSEVSPARNRELREHLRNCTSCMDQVRAWRSGMSALDTYRLPVIATHARSHFAPVLRWAAAAAAILLFGFMAGRVTSGSHREIRELQASVARLQQASAASDAAAHAPAILATATQAANEETVRLLNEYTAMVSLDKAQERRATALALRALEEQYQQLRGGLE